MIHKDLQYVPSGVYVTDILYGPEPLNITMNTLSGGSDYFTSIQVSPDTGFETDFQGLITIGSLSGIQVVDIQSRQVIQYITAPTMVKAKVEDFS
jgi:hypothetical protein